MRTTQAKNQYTNDRYARTWLSIISFTWLAGGYVLLACGLDTHVALARFGIIVCAIALIKAPFYSEQAVSTGGPVYIIILVTTLVIALVSALGVSPVFSVSRALLCGLAVAATYRAVELLIDWSIIDQWRWVYMFNVLLLLFLGFLVLGGIVFPHWREGIEGTRLSGGTNPNSAGFYGLLALMWTLLLSALKGNRTGTDNAIICCAIVVIFWSGSRSVLFAALTFLLPVALIALRHTTSTVATLVARLITGGIVMLVLVGGAALINPTRLVPEFEQMWNAYATRLELAQDENVITRLDTWNYLLEEWRKAPWTGSLGWYYTSRELNEYGVGETLSSHSFYVRTLAEVGLLGFAAALLLPCYGIVIAVKAGARLRRSDEIERWRNRARLIVIVAIIALFVREMGEDSYLTEFISPTTAFLLFCIGLVVKVLRPRGV